MRRQCELVGVNRSGLYYDARAETELNCSLMRRIDEQYTRTPFYGSRKMLVHLRGHGFSVNRKRVARLMSEMGLLGICPGPATSQAHPEHVKYPYLLRHLHVFRPCQVWCTDITYVRLQQGYVYLVAVMDWFSRYILSWRLSPTMDVEFCIEALEAALLRGQPSIFNSDQGSQFTSASFVQRLLAAEVQISMDGRGRAADNIFIERFWRSFKYEEVYLKDYQGMREARPQIASYMDFYNDERPHQSLGYRTPRQVHFAPEVKN
jgi:putative transposase